MTPREELLDIEAQLSEAASQQRHDIARESDHYDHDSDLRYASWRSTEPMPSRAEARRMAYEMGEL